MKLVTLEESLFRTTSELWAEVWYEFCSTGTLDEMHLAIWVPVHIVLNSVDFRSKKMSKIITSTTEILTHLLTKYWVHHAVDKIAHQWHTHADQITSFGARFIQDLNQHEIDFFDTGAVLWVLLGILCKYWYWFYTSQQLPWK